MSTIAQLIPAYCDLKLAKNELENGILVPSRLLIDLASG